jgi:ABC-type microcin C transport system permease subunit YejB
MKFRMSLVDALISVFLEKVANISYELTSRRDYPNHFAKLNIVSIRGKNHL